MLGSNPWFNKAFQPTPRAAREMEKRLNWPQQRIAETAGLYPQFKATVEQSLGYKSQAEKGPFAEAGLGVNCGDCQKKKRQSWEQNLGRFPKDRRYFGKNYGAEDHARDAGLIGAMKNKKNVLRQ